MTEHKIKVGSPWFEHIRENRKKYEGRCNWKVALNYKVGDTLHIHNYHDPLTPSFKVTVEDIIKFATFEEALKTLPLNDILPSISTIEEGVNIYYKFVSAKTQKENGIIMIKLKDVIHV